MPREGMGRHNGGRNPKNVYDSRLAWVEQDKSIPNYSWGHGILKTI